MNKQDIEKAAVVGDELVSKLLAAVAVAVGIIFALLLIFVPSAEAVKAMYK